MLTEDVWSEKLVVVLLYLTVRTMAGFFFANKYFNFDLICAFVQLFLTHVLSGPILFPAAHRHPAIYFFPRSNHFRCRPRHSPRYLRECDRPRPESDRRGDSHGQKTLVFLKGRYDFWPDGAIRARYFISNTSTEAEDSLKTRTIGMLFKNARNLTLEGNGALFVFHGKMTTILLDRCENVTLQNIHVDFERPTMSEMRYARVSDGAVELDIHRDARYAIRDGRLEWFGEGWKTTHFHAVEFDTTLKTMRYSDWETFNSSKATEIAPYRLFVLRHRKILNPNQAMCSPSSDIIRDQVGMLLLKEKM